MKELGQICVFLLAALPLAAGARRVGAPYPVFLALGGALLAFLDIGASFSLPAELALALFVGLAVGTYSSIFVAAPLLAVWKEKEPYWQERAQKLERRKRAGKT